MKNGLHPEFDESQNCKYQDSQIAKSIQDKTSKAGL